MSDANRTAIRYIEETTWGETPASPTFQEARYTGESLNFNIENITSSEIRSDRQIDDLVQVGAEAGGDINFELSYKAYDDFIEGAMFSTWTSRVIQKDVANIAADATGDTFTSSGTPAFNTYLEVGQFIYTEGFAESANNGYHEISSVTATVITVTTALVTEAEGETVSVTAWIQTDDISADETGGVYTIASAANVDFTEQNLNVGQWIKISGFTESANNGFAQITVISATTLTLVGLTIVDEVAGDTITIQPCDYIRNGTTEKSYAIERAHLDKTQFFLFNGMEINQMSMTVEANAIVTGAFSFMGKTTSRAGATSSTGGTPTSATTEDILNAVTNVGQIREGGAALASDLFIQSLDYTLVNNVRGIPGVGTLGSADMGVGSVDLTGSMSVYFKDGTLYDKYIGGTETSLSFKFEDTDGNAYIFTFPRIKFESDSVNAGGINTDVVEEISWRAIRDSTTDCTIQIDRLEV